MLWGLKAAHRSGRSITPSVQWNECRATATRYPCTWSKEVNRLRFIALCLRVPLGHGAACCTGKKVQRSGTKRNGRRTKVLGTGTKRNCRATMLLSTRTILLGSRTKVLSRRTKVLSRRTKALSTRTKALSTRTKVLSTRTKVLSTATKGKCTRTKGNCTGTIQPFRACFGLIATCPRSQNAVDCPTGILTGIKG